MDRARALPYSHPGVPPALQHLGPRRYLWMTRLPLPRFTHLCSPILFGPPCSERRNTPP